MIEMEKRGRPAVAIVSRGFEHDAARSARSFGTEDLALAVAESTFTSHLVDDVRSMARACVEQIERGLRERAASRWALSSGLPTDEWLRFQGSDVLAATDELDRTALAQGWGDGFPLRAPTRQRLERMLAGTTRSAETVVGVLEPGFGVATVAKIAANAIMAGCEPAYLPVVIAAIECLADPQMNLRSKAMSTGPQAPLIVVNGPIAKEIGLNSGRNALGPGAPSRANTAIGRAVRLCMMNIGHTYPDVADMDTIGSPTKYSMCVAENEDASPWAPYSVDRGVPLGTSAVTILFTYGICELHDFISHTPEGLVNVFASAATNGAQVSTGHWLVGRRADSRHGTEEKEHHFMLICPEHTEIFGRAGWSRADVQRAMWRTARMPFGDIMRNKQHTAMRAAHPELGWLWDAPETMLPVLEDPACYEIAVVGATAGRGAFFWGAGGPVTKPVTDLPKAT